MEFRIDYDPAAFGAGVEDAVHEGVAAIAARLQEALDEVWSSCAGHPAGEVAERLRQVAAEHGFDLDQADLVVCAATIGAGRRMDVSIAYR